MVISEILLFVQPYEDGSLNFTTVYYEVPIFEVLHIDAIDASFITYDNEERFDKRDLSHENAKEIIKHFIPVSEFNAITDHLEHKDSQIVELDIPTGIWIRVSGTLSMIMAGHELLVSPNKKKLSHSYLVKADIIELHAKPIIAKRVSSPSK